MDRNEFYEALEKAISGFSGELGLAAKNLGSEEEILVNANTVFPTASCIKVFILGVLLREIEADRFALDQRIAVKTSQQVGGSGILKELHAGLELTLKDVATLMIVLSDNTATNMIIDLLGLEFINESIKTMGFKKTELRNRIDFDAIGENVQNFAVSTPLEFRRFLDGIAVGNYLSKKSCEIMIDIMMRQQYLDQIARFLDYNPYARELGMEQDLTIANKTGFFMGVRCDAALLFYKQQKYTMVVFTRGCIDHRFNIDNEGSVFVGKIAEIIFRYFVQ